MVVLTQVLTVSGLHKYAQAYMAKCGKKAEKYGGCLSERPAAHRSPPRGHPTGSLTPEGSVPTVPSLDAALVWAFGHRNPLVSGRWIVSIILIFKALKNVLFYFRLFPEI